LLPSSRDYIAKYTHPIATGTFNRCYASRIDTKHSTATLSYTAPDAPPHGASFTKIVTLHDDGFTVSLDTRFPHAPSQRARQVTSFAIDPATRVLRLPTAIGFYEPSKRRLVGVAWAPGAVQSLVIDRHDVDALLTLILAPGRTRMMRYAVVKSENLAAAQARLRALANRP
jgi:hypothetical protein